MATSRTIFDVNKWAAPEFSATGREGTAGERWETVTAAKLPEATALRLG